ncbi:hypothetical protein PV10_02457 [Exophiala mesophila]|uniref:Uncharacterized protein n=1 Tax=Exophiala mesophila TaxID=212818 RepID=A0A0D1ZL96_EXOME|nr:uncharacterized protein PV10_02457 [Exophiala mesophila]KIV94719.1 hypothetical protein PV10_02457 [Exophiala mesophila]
MELRRSARIAAKLVGTPGDLKKIMREWRAALISATRDNRFKNTTYYNIDFDTVSIHRLLDEIMSRSYLLSIQEHATFTRIRECAQSASAQGPGTVDKELAAEMRVLGTELVAILASDVKKFTGPLRPRSWGQYDGSSALIETH